MIASPDRSLRIPGSLAAPPGDIHRQVQYVSNRVRPPFPIDTYSAFVSFIPIVILALVFNLTNAVGFTYA